MPNFFYTAWKGIIQGWVAILDKVAPKRPEAVDSLRARHATGTPTVRAQKVVRPLTPVQDAARRDATMVEMSVSDLHDLQRYRTEASLRRAEEMTMIVPAQAVDDMGWESYERIHRLREALDGIGHVGPQFDAAGRPVGSQVSVSLTMHEAEALMLLLAKRRQRIYVNDWETVGVGE